MHLETLIGGAAALVLAAAPAAAAVSEFKPDASIATAPYVLNLGSGNSLTFTSDTSAFASSIGVQTGGAAEVFSSCGAPAFQLSATSLFPSQQLGVFASDSTAAGIPYSTFQEMVGFEYTLSNGLHYGIADIADIAGSRIENVYLQSTPGAALDLGVPEPAAWAMMLVGIGIAGAGLRRARAAAAA